MNNSGRCFYKKMTNRLETLEWPKQLSQLKQFTTNCPSLCRTASLWTWTFPSMEWDCLRTRSIPLATRHPLQPAKSTLAAWLAVVAIRLERRSPNRWVYTGRARARHHAMRSACYWLVTWESGPLERMITFNKELHLEFRLRPPTPPWRETWQHWPVW